MRDLFPNILSELLWDNAVECQEKAKICKIWGLHGGDYEELCLLGCYAVWFLK
jgi:hypothetical protein